MKVVMGTASRANPVNSETNSRARRTYSRLGFLEEGLLREEYFHEDGWHNMLRMSLLAREWKLQ